MSRYIDADALIKSIESDRNCSDMPSQWIDGVNYAIDLIELYEPTIEPKRGVWIEHEGKTIVADNNFVDFFPTEYECSNCGLRQATYLINSTLPNFCPNCGADMRKGE